jgi:hypothetical protein
VVSAPLGSVRTDLAHGGRWTSLRLADREWLWSRDEPRRAVVSAGDRFVDAGGLEECIPTVRGTPDHGAAWSRAWRREGEDDVVECAEFRLSRRLRCEPDAVLARYRLTAEPGFRFVWAAHALLDVSPQARLVLRDGADVRLYPEAGPSLPGGWPNDAAYVVGTWPAPLELPLSRLGPDDGTAIGAVVLDCREAQVIDSADRLVLRLDAESTLPTSVALWRNLGGFPQPSPYRSIGVEPMLGRVFDLAEAGPGDAVTVPASGTVEWQLHLSATAEGVVN